ncbi:hypothetical protein BIFADO_01154 [Bifidobacterium adolescentis L2-32]|uniref:Uncharacterized protein n=1 Tax=Bifidobacterium adolescentis L2-32 TaxID=411481 RepID=A7A5N4_BIFAD|nr:hypothetical protein BIFADO_01154 [Bifidobacterium adolescentis L2-32]
METSFSYAEIIRAEDIRKDKKAAISDRGHNRKKSEPKIKPANTC